MELVCLLIALGGFVLLGTAVVYIVRGVSPRKKPIKEPAKPEPVSNKEFDLEQLTETLKGLSSLYKVRDVEMVGPKVMIADPIKSYAIQEVDPVVAGEAFSLNPAVPIVFQNEPRRIFISRIVIRKNELKYLDRAFFTTIFDRFCEETGFIKQIYPVRGLCAPTFKRPGSVDEYIRMTPDGNYEIRLYTDFVRTNV